MLNWWYRYVLLHQSRHCPTSVLFDKVFLNIFPFSAIFCHLLQTIFLCKKRLVLNMGAQRNPVSSRCHRLNNYFKVHQTIHLIESNESNCAYIYFFCFIPQNAIKMISQLTAVTQMMERSFHIIQVQYCAYQRVILSFVTPPWKKKYV